MTSSFQWLCQKGTNPLSTEDTDLDRVRTFLKEIAKPVAAPSTAECSIELVVLCTNAEEDDFLTLKDLTCLSELLDSMGLDSQQVMTWNNTIGFNVHHLNYMLDAPEIEPTLPFYSTSNHVSGICWTWDPLSRSTRGLLWHRDKEGQRRTRFISKNLSRLGPHYSHGLLPALLALQIENTEIRNWIHNQADEILACQIQTGHHYYAGISLYGEDGDNDRESELLDLAVMSRKICGLAVNATTSVLCLQRLVQFADFILDEIRESMKFQQAGVSNSDSASHSPGHTHQIVQWTCSAKREAEGLLRKAEAWKHKSSIVFQTLLSLTTQRDQNLSIQIAEDSRILARKATRDSESMKAIAAVTMCFLPGTFVASLFAMPILDWNNGSGQSLHHQFWIYWAVTLPLTMVVIGVWLTWTNKGIVRDLMKLKRIRSKKGKEV